MSEQTTKTKIAENTDKSFRIDLLEPTLPSSLFHLKYASYSQSIVTPAKDIYEDLGSSFTLETFSDSSPLSENDIRQLLLDGRIPRFFLQNIQRIAFLGEASKELNQQYFGNPDMVLGGLWQPVFSNFEVQSATIVLFAPENDIIFRTLGTENPYIRILAHEIGHNTHALLGEDTLKMWEAAVKRDNATRLEKKRSTAVTLYVQFARDQDQKGAYGYGDREDFAESFSLFTTNPRLLYDEFPERYQAMLQIFNENTTNNEEHERFLTQHAKQMQQRIDHRSKIVNELANTPKQFIIDITKM